MRARTVRSLSTKDFGREEYQGRPKKWEAHEVHLEMQAMMFHGSVSTIPPSTNDV